MVPALHLLETHGKELGLSQPWQYFWLTGGLSAFLDNAPTYLTFATVAAGSQRLEQIMVEQPAVLRAISCGAVFLGALTYVGNAPNFMVKAIAENAGLKMPSFFGYMLRAGLVLLPICVAVTWLFFVE
jgi:Na+/H+ antiporter NhaD/arsenite permease-like protein